MTTIAASTKTMSIASDLQFTYNAAVKFKGGSKILEVSNELSRAMFNCDKAFLGFCGNADAWGRVVSWFASPTERKPKCKNLEFLLLTNKGDIYHATNLTNWMRLDEPHFSIGSGMHFAIGAMAAGKSPKEACIVAAKHDIHTGFGAKEYKFD